LNKIAHIFSAQINCYSLISIVVVNKSWKIIYA
jgi:hypothetical protein